MQYLSCGRRALGIEGWGNASREAEGDDAESVLPKRSSDAEETEREGGTESGVERGGERERGSWRVKRQRSGKLPSVYC